MYINQTFPLYARFYQLYLLSIHVDAFFLADLLSSPVKYERIRVILLTSNELE